MFLTCLDIFYEAIYVYIYNIYLARDSIQRVIRVYWVAELSLSFLGYSDKVARQYIQYTSVCHIATFHLSFPCPLITPRVWFGKKELQLYFPTISLCFGLAWQFSHIIWIVAAGSDILCHCAQSSGWPFACRICRICRTCACAHSMLLFSQNNLGHIPWSSLSVFSLSLSLNKCRQWDTHSLVQQSYGNFAGSAKLFFLCHMLHSILVPTQRAI